MVQIARFTSLFVTVRKLARSAGREALLVTALVACVSNAPPPQYPQQSQAQPEPGAVMVSEAPMPANAQTCREGATCNFSCDEGNCGYVCEPGSICNVSCDGGNCAIGCRDGAICNLGCDGGNCRTSCDPGSTCQADCDGGSCEQGCAPGATCSFACDGGSCR